MQCNSKQTFIHKHNPITMEAKVKSYGRTELAQLYFPQLTTDGAWHKLRSWLHLNPRLEHFYASRRRTFTPAEVALIFTELGEP